MVRPMANLFAVADRDPDALDRIESRLRADGEVETVWRPAPGWVAASASLPGGDPDSEELRNRGFAFVEGRDRLERGDDLAWLERVETLSERPERLAELPGDFGFLRWRSDGTVLAVRSCAGLVPLYLHQRSNGALAIGTRLAYFPRFLPDRFQPDPLVNASYTFTAMLIDGRTFLAGVSILPRATCTRLAPGRRTETTGYWDPRPEPGEAPPPSPDHARELRTLLIATLERDLDPDGRSLLYLSGGVDSASVGALAAGVVGRKLCSWSMVPAVEPQLSHELSYIDPLLARFGIEPSYKRKYTPELKQRWTLEAPGPPIPDARPGPRRSPHRPE